MGLGIGIAVSMYIFTRLISELAIQHQPAMWILTASRK
jgi:hypothetical protein